MDAFYKQLQAFGRVKTNEPMAKHTTFKIGGPVRYFILVDSRDNLTPLLHFLSASGTAYFIIGGGSNLLWTDNEYDGVVIQYACQGQASLASGQNGWNVRADACLPLAGLVGFAARNGLSGLEWAIGIPGTVGGAVRGNAGAMGKDISGAVAAAEVWRDNEIIELTRAECTFSYRGSVFKSNTDIILGAKFLLPPGDKREIMAEMQSHVTHRLSHVPKEPSAGSFFKNIKLDAWPGNRADLPEIFKERGTVPVGWLVEQLGLRGYSAGGAKISDNHGNFILNTGGATQRDVLTIIEAVKEKVYNKFGVEIEPEVQIITF